MPSIRPVVPSAGRARDEPPEARRSVLRREVSAEGEADATSARANAEAMTSARRREGIETGVVSRGDSARARRSVSRGGVVERKECVSTRPRARLMDGSHASDARVGTRDDASVSPFP
jgi:hypothetical protein